MKEKDNMNRYDAAYFSEPIDRCGTHTYKWDMLQAKEGRELLPVWVADMDFRCAEEVTAAVVRRAKHPVYGYTEQPDSLTEAMLDFMKRRHGVSLAKKQQLTLPGVVPGLRIAVQTFTEVGDGVLVQPPVYGPFFDSITQNDRRLVENPLIPDEAGRYHMDLEGMETAFRSGVKLALLCNPHNPVARAWTREELQSVYSLCKRYGVMLVADEIHQDFVYESGAFVSAVTLDESADAKIVVLTSAGKTFNLAGLQQGVLFTRNQQAKQAMEKAMCDAGVASGNIFALTATEAAYRWGEDWLNGLLAYLADAHILLKEALAEKLPDAVMSPQEATFLAWIDLRAYGFTTAELMRRTHEQGVALSPGTFFSKTLGEGFLRFNFGCPHSQTIEAVERLAKAIRAY
ncbi:MAG: PatB family C-S lyase [Candidatus Pacebacteria bacterium]|nr:PatB family C-S lyase [Candidatus Paceibacterota bacterium]